MGVTGNEVVPGVQNADDRLPGKIFCGKASLFLARPMAKRTQIVRAQITMTSKLLRGKSCAR
jgi:hypothetical protein